MKKYNWEKKIKEAKNPSRINWLWLNHKRLVTRKEFIREMKFLKRFSQSKSSNRYTDYRHKRLSKNYDYLKEVYGFFIGE